MSIEIHQPLGRFLRLAMSEYIASCGGRDKVSAAMVEDFIDRSHDAWHKANEKKRRPAVFTPPTAAEVEKYSHEIRYPLDGEGFCLHYEQKDWHTGNAKMRNWKAAVRNWKRNGWKTKHTPHSTGQTVVEPVGWLAFMRVNYPDWVEIRDGRTPTWDQLSPHAKKQVIELITSANEPG